MKLRLMSVQKDTKVQYLSKELLFLSQSGQPYRGTLYVNFTSLGETFDLRDLKHYITSLRSQKITAEDIAYTIYSVIEENVKTQDLGVVVDLSARGGIQQRIQFGSDFEVVQKANIFQIE